MFVKNNKCTNLQKQFKIFCFIISVSNVSPKNIVVLRNSWTTIMVSWTNITQAEARSFIKNYTILYYPSTGSVKRQLTNAMTKTVEVT